MTQQITQQTSQRVLTNDSQSMLEDEVKQEERVICATCQTPATNQTISNFRYCKDCPTVQDHRIFYCNKQLCSTMIDIRHRNNPNLNHNPNLKSLDQDARAMVILGQHTLRNTYNTMVQLFERNRVSLATHTLTQVIHFSTVLASGVPIERALRSLSSNSGINTLGMANVIVFGIETSCSVARWFSGALSGRDLAVKIGRSAAINATGYLGAWAGGKAGAAIGGIIGGPIGAVFGGIIGIFAGNLGARKLSGKLYDKYVPEDDEKARRVAFKNALAFFQFRQQDVNNPQIFNETTVRQAFRQSSLRWHPDRNGGSNERFIALTTHYAVLLAHLDKKNNNNRNNEISNNTNINNPLAIQP